MKAVIFDFDGTLVDSLPGIAGSLNRALASLGFDQHADPDVRRFIGNGSYELARQASPKGTPNEAVILRVATTGNVLPAITGVDALATATSGGQRVTLFAITDPGLFELTFTGNGAYSADLRVAGDIVQRFGSPIERRNHVV